MCGNGGDLAILGESAYCCRPIPIYSCTTVVMRAGLITGIPIHSINSVSFHAAVMTARERSRQLNKGER